MFDPSSIIVGLEIGTSKVCAVVGEVNQQDGQRDEEQMERERRDGQYESAELHDRPSDDVRKQDRNSCAGHCGGGAVPAVPGRQDRAAVAAHHVERRLTDGELMRETQKQHQPNGPNRETGDSDPGADRELISEHGRIHRDRGNEDGKRDVPS